MRSYKKSILSFLGVIAIVAIIGFAGRADYNELVMQEMGNETYLYIYSKLGHGCSNDDIVKEYKSNQTFYDNLISASWEGQK